MTQWILSILLSLALIGGGLWMIRRLLFSPYQVGYRVGLQKKAADKATDDWRRGYNKAYYGTEFVVKPYYVTDWPRLGDVEAAK